MYNHCLPPCWCLECFPSILHTIVIWFWCAPFIPLLWHNLNLVLAHLHHVWEIYNMHGRTRQALQRAIVLIRKRVSIY